MIQMWKGNELPPIDDTIKIDGTPVDLSTSTVAFSMRPKNSANLKIDHAGVTQLSPTDGTIRYSWQTADVDTVGSYMGWWTVTTSGKSQDTAEFEIDIVEHAPASIVVPTAVAVDGTTTIYQGDAYLKSHDRQLQYELETQDAPDLTGSTVIYRIEGENHWTMTVVDDDAAYLELTSADTTALTPATYAFDIRAMLGATDYATLLRGQITIVAGITSP
jgi:hypothetical protein